MSKAVFSDCAPQTTEWLRQSPTSCRSLALSADFSTSGNSSRDLFNNWFSTLAANLFGPIFDGGQRQAEVVRNESIARQRFYSHGQIILEAIGEVENSLVREKEQQTNSGAALKPSCNMPQKPSGMWQTATGKERKIISGCCSLFLSQQGLQRNILTGKLQLINFRIALYRALSGRIPLLETGMRQQDNPENR